MEIRNPLVIEAPISLSDSIELFTNIQNASRLLGHDLQGPQIRKIADKIVSATVSLQHMPSVLDKITKLDKEIIPKTIHRIEYLEQFKQTQDDVQIALDNMITVDSTEVNKLRHQVNQARKASGLTLKSYDFSRTNLFPKGWAMIINATGKGRSFWDQFALFVPCDEDGHEMIQDNPSIAIEKEKFEKESPTEMAISLARIKSPYPDAPDIVKADLINLITIDEQRLKINPPDPFVYKIYNSHHVITPAFPPRFHRPIVYSR